MKRPKKPKLLVPLDSQMLALALCNYDMEMNEQNEGDYPPCPPGCSGDCEKCPQGEI